MTVECGLEPLSAQTLVAQATILLVACLTGSILRSVLNPTAGMLAFAFFAGCLVLTRLENNALEGVRAAFLGTAALSVVFCRVLAVQSAKVAASTGGAAATAAAAPGKHYRGPVRCVAQTLVLCTALLGMITFSAHADCVGGGHLNACVFRAGPRGQGVRCERPDSVNQWERMWSHGVADGGAPRVWTGGAKVHSLGFEVDGKVQGVSLRRAIKGYADKHKLKGWVRNTKAKGSVVGRVQGTQAHLTAFRKWLDQPGGPVTAGVPAPGSAPSKRDGGARVDKVVYNEDVLECESPTALLSSPPTTLRTRMRQHHALMTPPPSRMHAPPPLYAQTDTYADFHVLSPGTCAPPSRPCVHHSDADPAIPPPAPPPLQPRAPSTSTDAWLRSRSTARPCSCDRAAALMSGSPG